jgi:hypothetical protein
VIRAIGAIAATEGKKMKTRVAMMLSISGVLVAGSAAALINTQVLAGSASPSAFSVEPTSPSVTAAPAQADEPVVTTTLATTPSVAANPQVAAAASSTQAVYAIGDAGSVTLDTSGDVLTIVGVTPAPGWTVTKSEADDAGTVEIKLLSGSIEVDFHANLLFGVVTTSVESSDASETSNSVTSNSVDDHSGSRHGGGDDSGSDD